MKGKVLVIDDEKQIRDLVAKTLCINEYEYEVCDGVVPAMKMISERDFDIIITDKNMPSFKGEQEGGMELLRYAKRIKPNIAMIMMTGYASVESITEAMHLGVCDFITKPFAMQDLMDKLDRIRNFQRYFDPDKMMTFYRTAYTGLIDIPGESRQQRYEYIQAHLAIMRNELDYLFKFIKSLEKTVQEQHQTLNNVSNQLADMINHAGLNHECASKLKSIHEQINTK